MSHGVNLPEIKKVFINYEVKNYELWLQMIGRGGRQGSLYEVYSFDQFHLQEGQKIKNYLRVSLADWTGFPL